MIDIKTRDLVFIISLLHSSFPLCFYVRARMFQAMFFCKIKLLLIKSQSLSLIIYNLHEYSILHVQVSYIKIKHIYISLIESFCFFYTIWFSFSPSFFWNSPPKVTFFTDFISIFEKLHQFYLNCSKICYT